MNWLLTADIHLSDRARDSYRFGLFPWLAQQQRKHKVDVTFILGDLTESKDRHSSALVNRIVEELLKLQQPVFILRGNHDGIDPNSPYFKFLNSIPGLSFVGNPTFLHKYGVAMIPHCQSQEALETACKQMPANPQAVFMHQTFAGAIAETGALLPGLDLSPVSALKPWLGVYSGDVHVPQRQGLLTYVGAPFHIRFNDNFKPRVLLLKGGGKHDLYFNAPRKLTVRASSISDIEKTEMTVGDQIKLLVSVKQEDLSTWGNTKKLLLDVCKKRGVEVYGVDIEVVDKLTSKKESYQKHKPHTKIDIFNAFCKQEGLPMDVREAGNELLG